MSQAGLLNISTSVLPPSVPIQFTTDSGVAVPALGNLNVLGGTRINTSASGSTITINNNGTTCLFSAYLSSTQSNVTGDGTVYIIPFNTALVNLGSAYNTGTGVFTAPTTGNYMFSCTVNLEGLLTGHTEGIFSFYGSVYESRFARYNMGAMATSGVFSSSGSFTIPMTAGDTMSVFAFVANGTKVVDVVGAAAPAIYTNFSGYLIP